MVPVPEEIVDSVREFVAWKVGARKVVEQPEALRRLWDDLDDELRGMLRAVAERTVDGGYATLVDVSDATGMTKREVAGAVGEIFARLRDAGRAAPLLLIRPDTRERPEGVAEHEHRVLGMIEADAEEILGY